MATKRKPIRKTAARTTRAKTPRVSQDTQNMESTAALASNTSTSRTTVPEEDWRKRFFIPVVIVLLAALAYFGLQQLVVATVNGAPISRITLMQEMESQIGEQVLDSLVTKQLISQAAKKQNITVSNEEIDQEIEKLKAQFSESGQDFDELLAMQGLTMDRVREEIRLQKIIEKAAGADVTVTDTEIDEFIEKNKAFLPEGQDVTDPALREDIKAQIMQQKVGEKTSTWIEQLKQEATIKYYGPFAQKASPTPPAMMPAKDQIQMEGSTAPEMPEQPAE